MSAEADLRARALLLAHLAPGQRREYLAEERITVVKEGLIWPILLRDLAFVLPFLPLLAVSGWRLTSLLLLATLAIGLLPLWLPGFTIACSPHREWIIRRDAGPELRAGRRRIRFCVSFCEPLPAADRVLAWKNLIEVSEPHLLRIANVRA